ncbi:PP2C family protein-serine/threonine phosphatase [Streptomyces sp. V3I7]|uniref:PP2C family protein-serine/threonine phosphatase n=1 Tax=Streptomyces sp. V3I7 TaxID=3042278 RepID=UPI00277E0F38|nr:PP2C family protein-serine/threonine phosphatase [Streptomyces sp. V3I7]MDQ0991969.1 serine phosphatase RsbU (regulator of sigma subunit) [Streptomyces sp. V3I7]
MRAGAGRVSLGAVTDDASPRRDAQPLRVRGRSIAWLLPLLLLAGIVLVDLNTSERFRIVTWIVLVPGLAASVCAVWTTAAFGVLSLVVYVAVDGAFPDEYRAGLADFILVAMGGALAVLACVLRVRHEHRMLHMRTIAETTRRTVLRPLPRYGAGLEQAAAFLAADSDANVGGDFYDIQPGPHGTRVLVGDVQGKGLGAVETAAALLGTFREAAYHEADLTTVARRLEIRMLRHRNLGALLGDEVCDRFATAVLVGFPLHDDGTVEIVNFGHEPPLAVGPGGVRQLPAGDGLPLGLGEFTGESCPPVHRTPLAATETLLLVTDGVTEARDAAGQFYPLVPEVTRALASDARTVEPRRLVALVRDGTLRHSGGHLTDDTTVFAVRRTERRPGAQAEARAGRNL